MNFVNTCKVISTRYGYSAFSYLLDSQVASEEVYFAQSILVRDVCLILNCWTLWFNIWTWCSWSIRPAMTAMGLLMIAWLGYEMYCLSCEARNTSCTCLSYIGRPGTQAVQFSLSINWYGVKDIDRNLVCSSTSLHPYWWNFLKNLAIYMKFQESPSFINIVFLSLQ